MILFSLEITETMIRMMSCNTPLSETVALSVSSQGCLITSIAETLDLAKGAAYQAIPTPEGSKQMLLDPMRELTLVGRCIEISLEENGNA